MEYCPSNVDVSVDQPVPHLQSNSRYANFIQALENLRVNPPGKSPVVEAFCAAALKDLNSEYSFPEFKQSVDTLIDRRDLEEPVKAQLFWRAFQSIIFNSDDHGRYPDEYTSSLVWQAAFRNIIIDKADHINKEGWILDEILAIKNVQSNEPLRYSAAKFALAVFAKQLPAKPSVLDSGTSLGYGPIQLGEGIPFRGIRIINESKEIRERFKDALRRKQIFSNIVSMDLVPDVDVGWVEMSAYPEELANTPDNAARKKFREALLRHSKAYKPVCGDLTAGLEGTADSRAKNGGQAFDVSMEFTAVYEITHELQPTAVQTVEDAASETGLVIVADFAKVNPHDKTKVSFSKRGVNDKRNRYNLLVKHKGSAEPEYEHLLSYSSGRCKQVYIEPRGVDRLMEMEY